MIESLGSATHLSLQTCWWKLLFCFRTNQQFCLLYFKWLLLSSPAGPLCSRDGWRWRPAGRQRLQQLTAWNHPNLSSSTLASHPTHSTQLIKHFSGLSPAVSVTTLRSVSKNSDRSFRFGKLWVWLNRLRLVQFV